MIGVIGVTHGPLATELVNVVDRQPVTLDSRPLTLD